MAVLAIKYSEDNLSALKELGFVSISGQDTRHGSFMELYTMQRKYRHYFGVYYEKALITIEELYPVLLLHSNKAIDAYLNSRSSNGT